MRTMHLIGTAAVAVIAAGAGFVYGAWTVAKACFGGGMAVMSAYEAEKLKNESENKDEEDKEDEEEA